MSEHLHSLPEPHSCSLSEHSLLFELRSTATSFPFLLTSAPNPHVPIPTLNLSFNPPLSVAGSLMFTPPPPQLLVPNPPDPALPTTTLLYPTQHIFGKRSKRAFPLKSGTLLIFSRLLLNDFLPFPDTCFFVFSHFGQITWCQLKQSFKISSKKC